MTRHLALAAAAWIALVTGMLAASTGQPWWFWGAWLGTATACAAVAGLRRPSRRARRRAAQDRAEQVRALTALARWQAYEATVPAAQAESDALWQEYDQTRPMPGLDMPEGQEWDG